MIEIDRNNFRSWFFALLKSECNAALLRKKSFAVLLDQGDLMVSIFEQNGGERSVLESIGCRNVEATTTTSAIMITGTFDE